MKFTRSLPVEEMSGMRKSSRRKNLNPHREARSGEAVRSAARPLDWFASLAASAGRVNTYGAQMDALRG